MGAGDGAGSGPRIPLPLRVYSQWGNWTCADKFGKMEVSLIICQKPPHWGPSWVYSILWDLPHFLSDLFSLSFSLLIHPLQARWLPCWLSNMLRHALPLGLWTNHLHFLARFTQISSWLTASLPSSLCSDATSPVRTPRPSLLLNPSAPHWHFNLPFQSVYLQDTHSYPIT